jgi:hypothetical protein
MPYACRALAREMPRPRRAGDDGPAAGAGRTWVAAAQVGKVLDHPLLLQLAMDRRTLPEMGGNYCAASEPAARAWPGPQVVAVTRRRSFRSAASSTARVSRRREKCRARDATSRPNGPRNDRTAWPNPLSVSPSGFDSAHAVNNTL